VLFRSQDHLWNYDVLNDVWTRKPFYTTYPSIEANVRGGVRCNRNYTWFFKGKRTWAYNGYKLLDGFPKIIRDPLYPNNPYTAVHKNGKIYLLKDNLAYEFDPVTLDASDEPEYVQKVFPDLPRGIQASVSFKNQQFMFKNRLVFKYDKRRNLLTANYPKIKHEGWFACFNYDEYENPKAPAANDLRAVNEPVQNRQKNPHRHQERSNKVDRLRKQDMEEHRQLQELNKQLDAFEASLNSKMLNNTKLFSPIKEPIGQEPYRPRQRDEKIHEKNDKNDGNRRDRGPRRKFEDHEHHRGRHDRHHRNKKKFNDNDNQKQNNDFEAPNDSPVYDDYEEESTTTTTTTAKALQKNHKTLPTKVAMRTPSRTTQSLPKTAKAVTTPIREYDDEQGSEYYDYGEEPTTTTTTTTLRKPLPAKNFREPNKNGKNN